MSHIIDYKIFPDVFILYESLFLCNFSDYKFDDEKITNILMCWPTTNYVT